MTAPFDALNQKGRDVLDTAMTSLGAVSQGLQTIASEAADYSRKSVEEGSALMQKLASIKSPEQALETQHDFARRAYESFVGQATRFSELYAELAREAYRPYEVAVARVPK
ncbi:phasin family protein [Phyllobacterium sp. 0TCS1.6C]|uniref:phasin family protein n=1 Tax=unclassified Phyllobacterium TaxID=2638441 RepID=UPI002264964A|nr:MULTISPECIES: phasin family protein [unclassified Phyllobacterium]MCX8280707.1 phasin family protein [Phyllobacterium sp. 0TCS1.6C]MCX8292716.1 phasin family protein [Phyllobacterium sp. 0TCS1.6A]